MLQQVPRSHSGQPGVGPTRAPRPAGLRSYALHYVLASSAAVERTRPEFSSAHGQLCSLAGLSPAELPFPHLSQGGGP